MSQNEYYDLVGFCGAMLFAFCVLPQTIKTIATKKADDLSWGFLSMWFFGELFAIIYNHTVLQSWPLHLNYYGNMMLLLPIIYVKLRYRHDA